ncbi:MAG: cell division protein FtsA [Paludibacteraceae bacterium]
MNTIEGWQNSSKYSTQAIDQIKDPNGASAKKQITSIPSPFARIDLVKTAFKTVADKDNQGNYNNLDGDTIFHKMVSDSLDVAQIFFEYAKLTDKVEIIPWDAKNDLKTLLDSKVPAHVQLGETYRLFMIQDAKSYNFDKLNRIYLLNYKRGRDEISIIGATSPATLFFCSANDLSDVVTDIAFGQDRPFDDDFKPLYKRDIEFHKYMWKLSKSIQDFASLFPEVYAYLQACYNASDTKRKSELQVLSGDMSVYDPIAVEGNAGNTVEVLGVALMQARSNVANIPEVSDFVIDSPLFEGENPPLVLPVDTFTQKFTYVRDPWDKNTKVPFSVSEPWQDRTLPDDGTLYPFLTISDFLEDYIIRTPYGMSADNRKNYFDGNIEQMDDISFALPIKDLFFEFFTVEQLQGTVGGQKLIEIKKNAGGVTVILRVPVKNNRFIEYRRNYYDHNEPQIAERNCGAIVEYDFAFAMLTSVKFANENLAFYRMGFVHAFSDSTQYTITCKRKAQKIDTIQHVRNTSDQRYQKGHAIALNGSNFDYVRLDCNNASGVIVPILRPEAGSDHYTFAVDFGTTNTHIEYKVNAGPTKEFDVVASDAQILPFAKYSRAYQIIFEAEFMPTLIGQHNKYNFPMRTAMTEARNTKWEQAVLPMVHAGFAFTYEKLQEYQYNQIRTNLKWSNDTDNIQKVKCYIESLMILLRNKVVLNNGDLQGTKIVWFYPISMSRARYNSFKQVWKDAYSKYFGDNTKNICAMTESLAPYEFYKHSNAAVNNIVTVDIGGGTTDVVMAEAGTVKHITSFRFAANSIFGDAYADNNGVQNGIIRQFKKRLEDTLKSNGSTESQLLDVYTQLNDANRSVDLASFLFSLKDNVSNKSITSNVDFNEILQHDSTQKMSFIFFYTAIIYHIANIMKVKGLGMPRHIAFSGNGSKVISILTTDSETLEDFTKTIFVEVYGESYPKDGLEILYREAQPKEATCKGGIICNTIQNYDDVNDTKVVLDSADFTNFIPSNFTYQNVDEAYICNTVAQVKKFIDFVFAIDKKFSFREHFDVDANSLQTAQDICYRDLETYMRKGLSCRLEEVDVNAPVEETLFFYPLIGMLHALADGICNIQ